MKVMAKRGRPRAGGKKPGWMLIRALVALEAFDQARRAGEKYFFAIEETVKAVRETIPEMPISGTEVKRVLAEFQPNDAAKVFLVTKTASTWSVSIGSTPRFRVNSKNRSCSPS